MEQKKKGEGREGGRGWGTHRFTLDRLSFKRVGHDEGLACFCRWCLCVCSVVGAVVSRGKTRAFVPLLLCEHASFMSSLATGCVWITPHVALWVCNLLLRALSAAL